MTEAVETGTLAGSGPQPQTVRLMLDPSKRSMLIAYVALALPQQLAMHFLKFGPDLSSPAVRQNLIFTVAVTLVTLPLSFFFFRWLLLNQFRWVKQFFLVTSFVGIGLALYLAFFQDSGNLSIHGRAGWQLAAVLFLLLSKLAITVWLVRILWRDILTLPPPRTPLPWA